MPAAMRCGCLAFFVALGVATAATARAQPNSVGGTRLSFVRAANAQDCITAPALEREIIRRMGRDPFLGPPRQWIEAFVEVDAGYYSVHLVERDGEGNSLGQRVLREKAGDCSQLDEAMVLSVALIIDPAAELAPASAARPASVPIPLVPDGVTRAPLQPATPVTPASPGHHSGEPRLRAAEVHPDAPSSAGHVTLEGVAVSGVLPGISPGAELVSTLPFTRQSPYDLRFAALYLPESRTNTELGELGYGLTALEAGACRSTWSRRFGWSACAAIGVGAIHSVVHQPLPFDPGDRFWAALRVEGGVDVHLAGPVWAETRLFELLALRRWEFRVRTDQSSRVAFRQSWLMPGLGLGLALRFY